MRRYVDLNRTQLLRLIGGGMTPAHKSCAEAVRNGAPFRVHEDTVARDGALRVYALRAQTAQLEGVPTIGVEEALKELARSTYPRLRVAAVSSDYDFVLFLDPECVVVVAVLGMAGRTPR